MALSAVADWPFSGPLEAEAKPFYDATDETVFMVQEYMVGQWSDHLEVASVEEGKKFVYQRAYDCRPSRLIVRTECVMVVRSGGVVADHTVKSKVGSR